MARRSRLGASEGPLGGRQFTAPPESSPPMAHPLAASPRPYRRPPAFTPVTTYKNESTKAQESRSPNATIFAEM